VRLVLTYIYGMLYWIWLPCEKFLLPSLIGLNEPVE
jgi:hypothetical protein